MQTSSNHQLIAKITELESKIRTLNLKLLETQPGADAAKHANAAAVQLRQDVEVLLTQIEDQKLQVAVAQSEKAQLQSDFQSELAERDFAFTNAQQTIASLEKRS